MIPRRKIPRDARVRLGVRVLLPGLACALALTGCGGSSPPTFGLMQMNVDAYGKKIPLQPGMLLKADIILDKRSLMNWLIDPLLSARM